MHGCQIANRATGNQMFNQAFLTGRSLLEISTDVNKTISQSLKRMKRLISHSCEALKRFPFLKREHNIQFSSQRQKCLTLFNGLWLAHFPIILSLPRYRSYFLSSFDLAATSKNCYSTAKDCGRIYGDIIAKSLNQKKGPKKQHRYVQVKTRILK